MKAKEIFCITVFATAMVSAFIFVLVPRRATVPDDSSPAIAPLDSASKQMRIPETQVPSGVNNAISDDPSIIKSRLRTIEKREIMNPSHWQALSEMEAWWMQANGFPPSLDVLNWSRTDLESRSKRGELIAKNQLMLAKIEAGETNWEDLDALRYGSAYYCRLRAAYEFGLIYPGRAAEAGRHGISANYASIRNHVNALAYDQLAQRFGDNTLLSEFYSRPTAEFRHEVTIAELDASNLYAEGKWKQWNQNRLRDGLPLLEIKFGARRTARYDTPEAREFRDRILRETIERTQNQ
jgi:hypothetical protein